MASEADAASMHVQHPSAAEQPDEPVNLPDEAVVVRGGLFRYDDFVVGLEAYNAIEPHVYAAINPSPYATSFYCWPGHTAEETVAFVRALGPNLLAHPTYRTSTIGALRAAGYELVVTKAARKHCSLFLDAIPSEEAFEPLRAAFGPAIHNPR